MGRSTRVALGRVAGPHGLRGQLRVRLFGAGPENLQRMEEVELAETPDAAEAARFQLEGVAPGRSGEARLRLSGVDDREAAAALQGMLVLGDPARLAPLPSGEFYWFALVGCRVEDERGMPVGTVRELWSTGPHDLLVVEGEAGEILIPAVEDLLRNVDVEEGRIIVETIPGLLDPAR